MVKIALGLMTALLLAACANFGDTTPMPQSSAVTGGVGHPSTGYPGPRAY
jgi:hypothetical protein